MATTPDGKPLLVKAFGRDAADGQLVAATWYAIWHRGAKRVLTGRREQVEHEAFLTLAAERDGVPVMPVIAAGETDQGDALLVIDANGGTLAALASANVTADFLRSAWDALGRLHELGISHGRVNAESLIVRPDGSAAFTDFGAAQVAAPDGDMRTDRAQLFVTTALAADTDVPSQRRSTCSATTGSSRCCRSCSRRPSSGTPGSPSTNNISTSRRSASRSPSARTARFRRWSRSRRHLAVAAEACRDRVPRLHVDLRVRQHRHRHDHRRFKDAEWSWLLAALVLSPLSQVPQAFSSMGATLQEIRFWPVLMLQYGVQFISLAVPSSAARSAGGPFWERAGVRARVRSRSARSTASAPS